MHTALKRLSLLIMVGWGVSSQTLLAQSIQTGDYLKEKQQSTQPIRAAGEDNLGWNFYFPDELEKELEEVPVTAQPPQTPQKQTKPLSVEWFKEHYPAIQNRAINNPTKENLSAELFAQKVMLDKSEVYGRKRQLVQSTDPFLQEGNRLPMFGTAATAMLAESENMKKEALGELFSKTGMLVFYDHACGYCHKMIPIINSLKIQYPDLDLRIMAKNTPNPDFIPNVDPAVPIYPDEIFKLAENLPIQIKHWPAFVMTLPPNDAYIIAQGAVPRNELFNRALNVGFEHNILGKDWYEKIYQNQKGLINSSQYALLTDGLEDDPVALINAVVGMIKSADESFYSDIFETGENK